MNLLFRLSRAKVLLACGKKLTSSKEAYIAFMKKKAAAEYKPPQIAVKDEAATREADLNALFCVIPGHGELIEKYGFPYCADRSDKENALAIMEHLTRHTYYCGATKNVLPDDAAEILPHTFDQPFNKAVNCRAKAIVLTDLLNACGIRALPVCAVSDAKGCHFLVNVWLKEENRFIVLDPSFNCMFADDSGRELSVHELRGRVIAHRTVRIDGYAFLGTEQFKDYYFSAFICESMWDLSTWKTNIREKKELSKVCGVKFDARVPERI